MASGSTKEVKRGGNGRRGEDGGKQGGGGDYMEPTEVSNWERVVDLLHTAFMEGRLTEEAMWQAVVLIPKGKKDYLSIGLVEMM